MSLAALGVSAGLLVADLGRPARFYNMLRVMKPTSPMSVGSWVLSAFGVGTGTAVGSDVLGVLPGVGALGDAAAAALAPAVATYTAVLVSDTSVPAWHEGRDELPFVFAGGAAASAAGLAVALRFIPYSDHHGHLHTGWTIVVIALGVLAIAASVYLVYVLEILKFTRRRTEEMRARDPETSEHEIVAAIERGLETGEFEAVRRDG